MISVLRRSKKDLKKVSELLWLYDLSIKYGQTKSKDGKIDYVEHRDKMLNVKFKILNLIKAKGGEARDVND